MELLFKYQALFNMHCFAPHSVCNDYNKTTYISQPFSYKYFLGVRHLFLKIFKYIQIFVH